jgi:subtilisin family serine protease
MKVIATLAALAAAVSAALATTAHTANRLESRAITVRAAEIAKPRPQRYAKHHAKRQARHTPHRQLTAVQKLQLRRARLATQKLAARRVVRASPGRKVLRHVPKPAPANAKVKEPVAAATPSADIQQTPNDPAWPQEWSMTQVRAPQAWRLSASHAVVVAVVDSGVDASQPDLQGAIVSGYNAIDGSANTADAFGHGTMVAGVIAARVGNGIGVAGTCSACSIMPIKVLDSSGAGTAASMADGIRWATDHGANIINLSLVLSGDDPSVGAAIAYAHDHGVLVVAAAGNASNDSQTFPASYPDVLSVAATDSGDRAYSWTTFGPWVAVAAPGCSMSTAMGGKFAEFCGTSAAAPLVAGLVGLAMSTGRATAADAGAALRRTAHPLPGVVNAGRVDALDLLQQFS